MRRDWSQSSPAPIRCGGVNVRLKIVTAIVDPGVTPSSPMFLVEYGPLGAGDQVDPTALPEGMLAAHTLTQTNGRRAVLTYWASEADFRRDGVSFGARFTSDNVSPRGYVGSPIRHPRPWYKKLTPLTWILSLTTALGALDALNNRYELLSAAPSVFIKPETGATNVHDAVENLPISVKFSLRNPLDIALRDLRVTAVLRPLGTVPEKDCSDCVPMNIDEENNLKLSAGESITLIAQARDTTKLKAGRWEVAVKATASAGYLKGEQAFPKRIPVEIWRPLAVDRLNSEPRGNSAGVLSGQIKVGVALPKGMECTAVVNGLSGLVSGRAALNDVNGNELIKSASWTAREESAFYRMKWESVAVEKGFTVLYFQVFVEGIEGTTWGDLKGKTEVTCYPNKPGE